MEQSAAIAAQEVDKPWQGGCAQQRLKLQAAGLCQQHACHRHQQGRGKRGMKVCDGSQHAGEARVRRV
jgi:hypothetical protein